MKIVWSPRAKERANDEIEYLYHNNPLAAKKWAVGLFERVKMLIDFPNSGRLVPELGRDDLRELIYANHRIFYKIENDTVKIVTLRHGKQLMNINVMDSEEEDR